jgi:hypothetical protein
LLGHIVKRHAERVRSNDFEFKHAMNWMSHGI